MMFIISRCFLLGSDPEFFLFSKICHIKKNLHYKSVCARYNCSIMSSPCLNFTIAGPGPRYRGIQDISLLFKS